MGKWSLRPLDCETWYGGKSVLYYKKHFNLPREILVLATKNDGFEHGYVPESYFKQLFLHKNTIRSSGLHALQKKLLAFYPLKKKAKKAVDALYVKNLNKLSNSELVKKHRAIRDWVHRLTIFDQFGWVGEELWTRQLQDILIKNYGLVAHSPEFQDALFKLTKPEEISTTLEEKRHVFASAIAYKNNRDLLGLLSRKLAKSFGWMPVFTFGESWNEEHYATEIKQLSEQKTEKLELELSKLKVYSKVRNKEFSEIVKKYGISKQDVQEFVDFGLALDARNEAEYFVSYAGQYLTPMAKEIAKRLYVSVSQLRLMYDEDMYSCLLGKTSPEKVLEQKGDVVGYGITADSVHRTLYTSSEAQQIYKHVESYVKPVQGNDSDRGTCASPGKAVGKVRIVPSPDQCSKVQEGDVLITFATTVDYLPAMKRAVAIVTEVGGLTCHAAVVSREFGIPCVVALSDAMTKFKDGDMVEVDANKGIVKKISQ